MAVRAYFIMYMLVSVYRKDSYQAVLSIKRFLDHVKLAAKQTNFFSYQLAVIKIIQPDRYKIRLRTSAVQAVKSQVRKC